ncbi:MAG: hypothetical protein PF483_03800, partial [Halothiobacillus sp.]|nr:hypothetical protein [Halothiobacillus sp.]
IRTHRSVWPARNPSPLPWANFLTERVFQVGEYETRPQPSYRQALQDQAQHANYTLDIRRGFFALQYRTQLVQFKT